MNRNLTRGFANGAWGGVVYVLTLLALVPLALVLWFTISKGWPAITHLEFFTNVERPVGIPGAGVAHAIAGTLLMVGIASLGAVPIGILGGIFLAEYPGSRWADIARLASDVLVGTPSIAVGLFAYALFVAPFHHFSGLAGSGALAVLMLPTIVLTAEEALKTVPRITKEAAYGMGCTRSQVIWKIVLPTALPGILTGVMLALARAAGETAPLMFTALFSSYWLIEHGAVRLMQPTASLAVLIYNFSGMPFENQIELAWAASLVLVMIVLFVNIVSRLLGRRRV